MALVGGDAAATEFCHQVACGARLGDEMAGAVDAGRVGVGAHYILTFGSGPNSATIWRLTLSSMRSLSQLSMARWFAVAKVFSAARRSWLRRLAVFCSHCSWVRWVTSKVLGALRSPPSSR